MADNNYSKRSASAATLSGSSVNLPTQQHGPCYWCFRAAKWVPVLFIVAVISWSYYAYVIQLCFCKWIFQGETIRALFLIPLHFPFSVSVQTVIEQIFFLLFYHIIFVMFVWSYWQTVFTGIGRVPSKVNRTTILQYLTAATSKGMHLCVYWCSERQNNWNKKTHVNHIIQLRWADKARDKNEIIGFLCFSAFIAVSRAAQWNGAACTGRESRNATTDIGCVCKRSPDKQSVIFKKFLCYLHSSHCYILGQFASNSFQNNHRRSALLRKVFRYQAGSSAPLQHVRHMRLEDGSPLYVNSLKADSIASRI